MVIKFYKFSAAGNHPETIIFAGKFIEMVKAVLFDMDGVLVDNRDVHIEAFRRLFTKYGLKFDREKFLPSFGMTNPQIFEWQAPELLKKHTIEELSEEKEALYRELFAREMAPSPGLIELLKGLRERGIKMAVGSSGNADNVNFVLTGCHIADYFDAIANGDMISRGKPDPEVYLLAAKLLNVDPVECVVCEDAPVGIEAARAAGMGVVALATTFPPERLSDYDLLVENFTQTSADEVLALR